MRWWQSCGGARRTRVLIPPAGRAARADAAPICVQPPGTDFSDSACAFSFDGFLLGVVSPLTRVDSQPLPQRRHHEVGGI